MPTTVYTGSSITSRKVIALIPPIVSLDGKEVKIGMGDRFLTWSGYNVDTIVLDWGATDDIVLKTVTASKDDSGRLTFTANTTGLDFEITALVDGSEESIAQSASYDFTFKPAYPDAASTFTITQGLETTGAITVSATRATTVANVQTAMIAMTQFVSGDVVASVLANDSDGFERFRLTYGGAYVGLSVPLPVVNYGSLTGGNSTMTVAVLQAGSAGANAQQTIDFSQNGTPVTTDEVVEITRTNTPTGGSITYTIDGVAIDPVDYNHSSSDLITSIMGASGFDTLDDPVSGDVTATGGPLPAKITLTFTQNYSGINIPDITYTSSGVNATQIITLVDATGGTFDLGFKEASITEVPYDITGASLQTLVRGMSTVGSTGATVTGSAGGPWTITLTNAQGEQVQPLFKLLNTSALTSAMSATVTTLTQGVAAKNESYYMYTRNYDDNQGTFEISYTGSAFCTGGSITINLNGHSINILAADTAQQIRVKVETALGHRGVVVYRNDGLAQQTFGYFQAGMLDEAVSISITTNLITSSGGTCVPSVGSTNGVDNASWNATGETYFLTISWNDGSPHIANTGYFTRFINAGSLQALIDTAIGSGNSTVTALEETNFYQEDGLFSLEFKGALAGLPVNCISTAYPTSDPHGYLAVVEYQEGDGTSGANEVQQLAVAGSPPTGTLLRLSCFGEYTVYFSSHGTAADVQAAIVTNTNFNVGDITCGGGPLPGTPVTMTMGGQYSYTDVAQFTVDYTYLRGKVVETATGSIAPTVNIHTKTQGADFIDYHTVGDAFTMIINSNYYVPHIPYEISADDLETRVNSVLGASAVSITDGPLPSDLVTVTFGGSWAHTPVSQIQIVPEYSATVVNEAVAPEFTNNSWELTVIPDEGTLGVIYSGNFNYFMLSITADESTETNKDIKIRFSGITSMRIEEAINEHFGRKVVSVTKVCRSQEWAPVALFTDIYDPTPEKFYTWYYRGVYRLTFINEFADPSTISSITLTLPQKEDDSGPVDPYDFMSADSSGPYDDLANESGRVAQCFQLATTAGAPLHLFQLDRVSTDTANKLEYKFKLRTQYADGTTVTNLGRVNVSDLPPEMYVEWRWSKYVWTDGNLIGDKTYTTVTKSSLVYWDATPEQHRAAIESMFDLTEAITNPSPPPATLPVQKSWVGSGNVVVTGSLINSWNPDPFGLNSTNYGQDYNDMTVTLTGALDKLPFNDVGYELTAVLIIEYDNIQNGSDEFKTEFRKPMIEGVTKYKPIPPLGNRRVRFDLTDSEIGTIQIGIVGETVALSASSTVSQIQDMLNGLDGLGQFPANILKMGSVSNPPAGTAPYNVNIISPRWGRSVTVYGTAVNKDPFEIELTGFGFQYDNQVADFIAVGSDANAVVTVIVGGQIQRPTIQSISMSHSTDYPITAGTFIVHADGASDNTSARPYTDTAASLQTALRLTTAIGSTGVTCTGGPINQTPIICTFAQALNNFAPMTVTPTLTNMKVTVATHTEGGVPTIISIMEVIHGGGSAYWDVAENWDTGIPPSSGDTVVFDDATTPVKYGLYQDTGFVVIDEYTMRYTRHRRVFEDGQKVKIVNGGTLPTNLTTNTYYFIRDSANTTTGCTFKLSATRGGSAIRLYTVTGQGSGTHRAYIDDVTLMIYSRYTGDQLGLPQLNGNIYEYLPQYLHMGFKEVQVGIDVGDPISTLRIDAIGNVTDGITIYRSGGTNVPNVPSLLFLIDSATTDILVYSGSVGLSVYSDQSSQVHTVEVRSGSMILNNCAVRGDLIRSADADVRTPGATTVDGNVSLL